MQTFNRKRLYTVLTLFFTAYSLKAQIPVSPNALDTVGCHEGIRTILLDSLLMPTNDTAKAVYYRTGLYVGGQAIGRATEYYLSGEKFWEGYLSPSIPEKKDSIARYFFRNGQLKAMGKYAQGLREGVWVSWNEDGSREAVNAYYENNALTFDELLAKVKHFKNKGLLKSALEVAMNAKEFAETKFGFTDSLHAVGLDELGELHFMMGNFADAEQLASQSLSIRKKLFGIHHAEYATSLNNLALIHYSLGSLADAEILLHRALEIYSEQPGEKDAKLIAGLINLAGLNLKMGKFSQAEQLFLKAYDLNKKSMGEVNFIHTTILNNLALLYQNSGRYVEAESLFNNVLKLIEHQRGSNHLYRARALSNTAFLYAYLGRYSQAEQLYKSALNIIQEQLNDNNPDFASTLNNLAILYKSMGKLAEAEQMLKRVLEIRRNNFDDNHPKIASIVNNIAALYVDMGRYEEAEKLFEFALGIWEKNSGGEYVMNTSRMDGLAKFLRSVGEYSSAEETFQKMLSTRKQWLGESHPAYASNLVNLASLYYDLGRYAEAESKIIEALNIYHKLRRTFFPALSEREKVQFWDEFDNTFHVFNSIGIARYQHNTLVSRNMYNNRLSTKSLILNSTKKIRRSINYSRDSVLRKTFDKWQSLREYLAKLYTLPKAELKAQNIDIDSIAGEANKLEKFLSRNSESFAREFDRREYTWEDVRNELKPGEAAIEIVRTKFYCKNNEYRIRYAALIITQFTSESPKLVLLDNGQELEETYLKKYHAAHKAKVRGIERLSRDAMPGEIRGQLYKQFWEMIQSELEGVVRVYISADGAFDLINLNTLFNSVSGKYLIEELEIHLVTSTKDLIINRRRRSSPDDRTSTAALFGFPAYSLDTSSHRAAVAGYKTHFIRDAGSALYGRALDSLSRAELAALPGTKREVQHIDTLLQLRGWQTNTYTAGLALEEIVKAVRSPRVLHIATHGYFVADIDDRNDYLLNFDRERVVQNPLLRSGLMFAGAQSTLDAVAAEVSTWNPAQEDGILTAFEAMNLHLDKTELVVLSACETGLGEVKYGEGVYGLQRAFLQAGARSVLMSLWKVDDYATQELMTEFYKRWLASGDKRLALREAQLMMKEKYHDPYYWGGFVMIGE